MESKLVVSYLIPFQMGYQMAMFYLSVTMETSMRIRYSVTKINRFKSNCINIFKCWNVIVSYMPVLFISFQSILSCSPLLKNLFESMGSSEQSIFYDRAYFTVYLPSFNVLSVKALLQFLYTGEVGKLCQTMNRCFT